MKKAVNPVTKTEEKVQKHDEQIYKFQKVLETEIKMIVSLRPK